MPHSNGAGSSGGHRRPQQLVSGAALISHALPLVGGSADESNGEAVAEGELDEFPPDLIVELAELIDADQQAAEASLSVAPPPQDVSAFPAVEVQGPGAGRSTDAPSSGVGVGARLVAEALPRAEAANSVPLTSAPCDVMQDGSALANAPGIWGAGPSGYITENGRLLGIITAACSGSRAVRCYMHPKCSIAIKEHRVPTRDQGIAWLQGPEKVAQRLGEREGG